MQDLLCGKHTEKKAYCKEQGHGVGMFSCSATARGPAHWGPSNKTVALMMAGFFTTEATIYDQALQERGAHLNGKIHMSNAILMQTRQQTEMCHTCLKHEIGKLPAFPWIPFPKTLQKRYTRLYNEIGMNLVNRFPLPAKFFAHGPNVYIIGRRRDFYTMAPELYQWTSPASTQTTQPH